MLFAELAILGYGNVATFACAIVSVDRSSILDIIHIEGFPETECEIVWRKLSLGCMNTSCRGGQRTSTVIAGTMGTYKRTYDTFQKPETKHFAISSQDVIVIHD